MPHYFAGEFNPSVHHYYEHFNQHLSKFIFHHNLLSTEVRNWFTEIAIPSFWYTAALITLFAIPLALTRLFKDRNQFYILLGLFLCAIFLLLPALHVPFTNLWKFENERYLYFFSVFAYPFVLYALFQISKPKIAFTGFIIIVAYQIYALTLTTNSKKEAAEYLDSYINNYQPHDGRTFIFNMPHSIKNHRVFLYSDGFRNNIELEKTERDSTIYNLLGVVTTTKTDSFYSKKINDSLYEFRLLTPGEWFIYDGYGASSYETSDYALTIGEWSSVQLRIKDPKPSDRVLYFEDLQFKEIR